MCCWTKPSFITATVNAAGALQTPQQTQVLPLLYPDHEKALIFLIAQHNLKRRVTDFRNCPIKEIFRDQAHLFKLVCTWKRHGDLVEVHQDHVDDVSTILTPMFNVFSLCILILMYSELTAFRGFLERSFDTLQSCSYGSAAILTSGRTRKTCVFKNYKSYSH